MKSIRDTNQNCTKINCTDDGKNRKIETQLQSSLKLLLKFSSQFFNLSFSDVFLNLLICIWFNWLHGRTADVQIFMAIVKGK